MKGKYRVASDWCGQCDRAWVEVGKKCPECGYRDIQKIPKPTSAQLIKDYREGKFD